MKKTILLLFSIGLFILNQEAQGQCTPGDSLSCPDPEGNGQICPDTLPPAVVNVPFSVEATILPPPSVTYLGATVPIERIELISVDNLPPGLTYQSNEPTGVFYPGTYYCVLLSGTPTDTGYYPLKIVVDAYVLLFGSPVYAGQQTDSTSLAIYVQPAGSTGTGDELNAELLTVSPNPFSTTTRIGLPSDGLGNIHLSVYDIQGRVVFERKLNTGKAEDYIFNGEGLQPGMYFYTLRGEGFIRQGKMVKE